MNCENCKFKFKHLNGFCFKYPCPTMDYPADCVLCFNCGGGGVELRGHIKWNEDKSYTTINLDIEHLLRGMGLI